MDSSTVIYKRLFEVQILHDYYLTDAKGGSFFSVNKSDQEALLSIKTEKGTYDIKDLFKIEPVSKTKKILNDYKLVFAKTSLGFIVGVEVKVELVLNEVLYKPSLVIDKSLKLAFKIQSQVPFFRSVTNISFGSFKPAIYYFTNKGKEVFNETDVVPVYESLSLANKPMTHQNGLLYEMGALVDFSGTLKEAEIFTDGNVPADWKDVKDKRCVTDADKLLLPAVFSYVFKPSQNITDAVFILEDKDSLEVKTITQSSTSVMTKMTLDFNKVDTNDPNSAVIPSGFYTLKMNLNGGATIAYPIHLNDELYSKDNFGVIEITFDEENSPFSLLDAQGFLKTRINAANEKITHPVFEIRLKNRSTYWRYHVNGNFSPAEVAATASFLTHTNTKLISNTPKSLTNALVPFINGSTLMLPHPKSSDIRIENDRIFSEIYISQSNRLLNS